MDTNLEIVSNETLTAVQNINEIKKKDTIVLQIICTISGHTGEN